ncbi:unnamed protein product [Amoebophrya sp. A25]|nr:unnamed protein product [Amoebophrya sp. A25]|eukprot:GSA25T00006142001.1
MARQMAASLAQASVRRLTCSARTLLLPLLICVRPCRGRPSEVVGFTMLDGATLRGRNSVAQ